MKKEDFEKRIAPLKKMADELRKLNEGEPKRRFARETVEMQIKLLTEMTLKQSADYRAANEKRQKLIKFRAEVNARVIANKCAQDDGKPPVYPDIFALMGFPEKLKQESPDDYHQRLALEGLLTDDNIEWMVKGLNMGEHSDSLTNMFLEVREKALKMDGIKKH